VVTAVSAATTLIAKNLEEVSRTVHAVGVLTEKPGVNLSDDVVQLGQHIAAAVERDLSVLFLLGHGLLPE
jgi:hypothetical protein